MTDRYAVVAAVDGSSNSRAAVRWAANEALRRGNNLFVVHICEVVNAGLWTTPHLRADFQNATRPIVDEAIELARETVPGVTVNGQVLLGPTIRTLLALSGRAELIVLGRSGKGALAAHLVGSVTARLAAHAHCPVIVVPTPPSNGRHPRYRPRQVVVGVADRPTGGVALQFGIDEAVLHTTPLLAVRAWHGPSGLPLHPSSSPAHPAFHEDEERELLGHLLASHLPEHAPPIRSVPVVRAGLPAGVLSGICHPEDLLVLGQHRHADFLPATVGRVISDCLHQAPCPVAVVPEPVIEETEQEQPRIAENAGLITY
ncbi:MAG TPA: universal stress protein [Jatrophihabitans sp.]|nr:universal stress protein [Jatrophihabitans sp.]